MLALLKYTFKTNVDKVFISYLPPPSPRARPSPSWIHPAKADRSDSARIHIKNALPFYQSKSLAHGSRKNVESTKNLYIKHCQFMRIDPFPFSFEAVAYHLIDHILRGNKTSGLSGLLSNLRRIAKERDDPFAISQFQLDELVKGLRRQHPSSPTRARACTYDVFEEIFATCDVNDETELTVLTTWSSKCAT